VSILIPILLSLAVVLLLLVIALSVCALISSLRQLTNSDNGGYYRDAQRYLAYNKKPVSEDKI
jgi:hypothetical protein